MRYFKKFNDLEWKSPSYENSTKENSFVLKKVLVHKPTFVKDKDLQFVNWSQLDAGKSITAHYHTNLDEIIICLSGDAHVKIESDEIYKMDAGSVIHVEPGEVHDIVAGKDIFVYVTIGFKPSEEPEGKTFKAD